MSLQGDRIEANGLTFHVVDRGKGETVLLLHGFPDSSYLWRHQIPILLDAGYRVLAPDLRGFGESDRPPDPEAYAVPIVLGDLTALLDTLGIERAHVVGHDWGATFAWLLATMAPERVGKLVVLSVGHPGGFVDQSIRQREMSWYMLLFQFAGVAEEMLTRDDWRLFRQWLRHHSELDHWIKNLSRPGALTAALNVYRANARPAGGQAAAPVFPPVAAPTLGIWSTGDAYLTEELMLASEKRVRGSWRYERVEDASHWMQLDQPERINELLLGFLRE